MLFFAQGGYDVIVASIGGLTHVTGEKDGGHIYKYVIFCAGADMTS
jgi:crotonobetainyl-CoA:carnitine CoA-transferase CaiB-like acyl-CoA transferase